MTLKVSKTKLVTSPEAATPIDSASSANQKKALIGRHPIVKRVPSFLAHALSSIVTLVYPAGTMVASSWWLTFDLGD